MVHPPLASPLAENREHRRFAAPGPPRNSSSSVPRAQPNPGTRAAAPAAFLLREACPGSSAPGCAPSRSKRRRAVIARGQRQLDQRGRRPPRFVGQENPSSATPARSCARRGFDDGPAPSRNRAAAALGSGRQPAQAVERLPTARRWLPSSFAASSASVQLRRPGRTGPSSSASVSHQVEVRPAIIFRALFAASSSPKARAFRDRTVRAEGPGPSDRAPGTMPDVLRQRRNLPRPGSPSRASRAAWPRE